MFDPAPRTVSNNPDAIQRALFHSDIYDAATIEAAQDVGAMTDAPTLKLHTRVTAETAPKVSIRLPFVIAYPDNLLALLAERGLSKPETQVLASILAAMEFGNLVRFSQSACAKRVALSRSTVSRAFKTLTSKGVLVKRDGNTYMNAALFQKGLPHRLNKERLASLRTATDTQGGKFAAPM